MINKTRKMERTLGDLPPRVIIHDILPFNELIIKVGVNERYHPSYLFGYFKKDGLRNIWFLFSSIEIIEDEREYWMNRDFDSQTSRKKMSGLVICLPRVVSLSLSCSRDSFINILIAESPRMVKLESISIVAKTITTDKILSNTSGFPNLKRVSFDALHLHYMYDVDNPFLSEWKNCAVFTRIKSLEITFPYSTEIDTEFFSTKDNRFRNLEVLKLHRHGRPSQTSQKITMNLPKLKHLEITSCPNFFVESVENLKIFEYSFGDSVIERSPHMDSVKYVISNAKNIEKLGICNFIIYSNDDVRSWFLNFNVNEFRSLKYLNIFQSTLFPSQIDEIIRLSDQLVSLSLDFNRFRESGTESEIVLPSRLLNQPFPNLKKLTIHCNKLCGESGQDIITGRLKLPFAKHLESLDLELSNENLHDSFFSENEFESLESLIVSVKGEQLRGASWNPFRRLREIYIRVHLPTKFTDSIFAQSNNFLFPSLEAVSLLGPSCNPPPEKHEDLFTGEKWHPTLCENLKYFRIETGNTFTITDHFFQNNEFRNLEILCFGGEYDLEGRNWNIDSMKKLSLLRCNKKLHEGIKVSLDKFVSGIRVIVQPEYYKMKILE